MESENIEQADAKSKPRRSRSTRRKRGRPTKLTPAVTETIAQLLRAGNYVETAAAIAGIHRATFYEWSKRGAEFSAAREMGKRLSAADAALADFSDTIEKAVAIGEAQDLYKIAAAAEENWQAAAWRLERRFPLRWGRYQRQEISGPDSAPVAVKIGIDRKALLAAARKMTEEELIVCERLLTALGFDDESGDSDCRG
jgi:transposase